MSSKLREAAEKDLLALDDITAAGAWMPEIGFVIASVLPW